MEISSDFSSHNCLSPGGPTIGWQLQIAGHVRSWVAGSLGSNRVKEWRAGCALNKLVNNQNNASGDRVTEAQADVAEIE